MRARLIEPPRQREIMTVFDEVERRTVAKAVYKPAPKVWLLKLYDGCWMAPSARVPGPVTGVVDASYLICYGRQAARRALRGLVDQINSA